MGNSTSSRKKAGSTSAKHHPIPPMDERKHRIHTMLAEQPKSEAPTKYSEMKRRNKSRKNEYERKRQVREAKVHNLQAQWEENRRQIQE